MCSPQPTTTRDRRRLSRGAAIIEGLIVAALVTVFLTSAIYMHGSYQAKLRAIRSARVGAWSSAFKGCSSSLDVSAVGGSIVDLSDGGDIPFLSAWLGLTDAAKLGSESYQQVGREGNTSTMTARCIVTCDERHGSEPSFGQLPTQFVTMATKDP